MNRCSLNEGFTQYRWRVLLPGASWTTLYTGSNSTYTYTFEISPGLHQGNVKVELQVRNNASPNLYDTEEYDVTVSRPQRVYHLKDHLGNVRTSVDVDGDVVGYDDYYPFGLPMPGRSSQTGSNPNDDYKFTGYELDEVAGTDLKMYHANARGYDPILGRFGQIDPLSSERAGLSPYNYVQNNPLSRIDPTGLLDDIVFNSVDEEGNKREIGRIVTDKYDQEINIDSELISSAIPDDYDPISTDLPKAIADGTLDYLGVQALSLDISAEAAFKLGVQGELSLIALVGGKNQGDWGVALQGNALLGVEGSFTGSVSAYWPISGGDLSLDRLSGFEYGIQGSLLGPSAAYFEGVEFSTSYPYVNRSYAGASIGGSAGIPELTGSGSGYLGYSGYLYRSDGR